LVDCAYRFGQLIDGLPLISKKESVLKALATALDVVEPARHHLQHLRGDLASPTEIDYPLLGGLAWSYGLTCYTLSFSQPGTSQETLIWDHEKSAFVVSLEYAVKDARIHFNEIGETMHKAYGWLAAKCRFEPPGFADLRWGDTFSTKMDFRHESQQPQYKLYRGKIQLNIEPPQVKDIKPNMILK
jgi:hypothetical protein